MKDKDEHFWIDDVINRLPSGLIPESKDWSSVLSALTKLKTERNNAIAERDELAAQVERLRCAYNSAKTWEDLGDVLKETPAQSLEAVKREWKLRLIERCKGSSFEPSTTPLMTVVPIYVVLGFEP